MTPLIDPTGKPAKALLRCLDHLAGTAAKGRIPSDLIAACCDADLAVAVPGGGFRLTEAGQAFLLRHRHDRASDVDPFRAQHLHLSKQDVVTDTGVAKVLVNDSESPLAWLARRKGRDGRCLIDQPQFIAGERLRADFTRGELTPRVTSNWSAPTGQRSKGGGAGEMTDLIVASRQRVRLAMDAVGPEFAGILLDVCCFLRGLEDVERERGWPSRSAKVVLQLALSRLAHHYGFSNQSGGLDRGKIRIWLAGDAGSAAEPGL